jgi:hypothetical protein
MHFLAHLSKSTEKEVALLMKYGTDEHLIAFRNIARNLVEAPLPASLTPFHDNVRALSAAQTPTDVRKIFLGNDLALHSTNTTAFFIDLADANEKEGNLLMTYASENHLKGLRDAAMDLLIGKTPLTPNQSDALEPFWGEIRELALAKTPKDISKMLFMHFAGRLLLLQGIIIPSLSQEDSYS